MKIWTQGQTLLYVLAGLPSGMFADQHFQNSVPAWGSYLYQNFLLPSISPSEWLNPPSSANQAASGGIHDYFNQSQDWATLSAEVKVEPAEVPQPAVSPTIQSEPSSLFPQHYYYNPVVPTSLLMAQSSSSQTVSSSVDHVDAEVTRSPSPLSSESSPQHSPMRGIKRRTSSMDSDLDDEHETEHEHDHDVPEGVERDGIIWGMKVEDYRSMSARERKRVRNRISARTFRAKRKGESAIPLLQFQS